MENLAVNSFWKDKRVLITGHTGFKASWLSVYLRKFGALIGGFSLQVSEQNFMYKRISSKNRFHTECFADIRNFEKLYKFVQYFQPDIIFHLAAQPLVRASYENPLETFTVNTLGTVNLLECVRQIGKDVTVINVTTDKCYENQEWIWPYRENEKLGGHDPYSASKACSEIVSYAYAKSFLLNENKFKIATARAGNVIGGGDTSYDRLIPDFFRCLDAGIRINLRNPLATRPWLHVVEPIHGYALLAKAVYNNLDESIGAWNFGPSGKPVSVCEVIETLTKHFDFGSYTTDTSGKNPYEAQSLILDSNKARLLLHWEASLNLEQSIEWTVEWYKAEKKSECMHSFTDEQIGHYLEMINYVE